MIELVESGEVGTIILKDSSRMGRDYLRTGLFREMFREKNVRLIAVNDGTDTFAKDDDFTPFREIMSEWYGCVKLILTEKTMYFQAKTSEPQCFTVRF